MDDRSLRAQKFKELVESLSYWQRRANQNQCAVIVLEDRRGGLYGIYDGEKEPEHWGPCEILCRIDPRKNPDGI